MGLKNIDKQFYSYGIYKNMQYALSLNESNSRNSSVVLAASADHQFNIRQPKPLRQHIACTCLQRSSELELTERLGWCLVFFVYFFFGVLVLLFYSRTVYFKLYKHPCGINGGRTMYMYISIADMTKHSKYPLFYNQSLI